ncbi:MAG TPA: hypothetical protein VHK90_07825 [Thermoanaerobaculia bacterium]|nr:hypothetical protein [Thermoanaerobaculia bacterium]
MSSGALIAFVDDEESLRKTVALGLQRDGFASRPSPTAWRR